MRPSNKTGGVVIFPDGVQHARLFCLASCSLKYVCTFHGAQASFAPLKGAERSGVHPFRGTGASRLPH
jgi:hypothetical protein